MKKCKKCNIYFNTDKTKCPLCQNELIGKNISLNFPKSISPKKINTKNIFKTHYFEITIIILLIIYKITNKYIISNDLIPFICLITLISIIKNHQNILKKIIFLLVPLILILLKQTTNNILSYLYLIIFFLILVTNLIFNNNIKEKLIKILNF